MLILPMLFVVVYPSTADAASGYYHGTGPNTWYWSVENELNFQSNQLQMYGKSANAFDQSISKNEDNLPTGYTFRRFGVDFTVGGGDLVQYEEAPSYKLSGDVEDLSDVEKLWGHQLYWFIPGTTPVYLVNVGLQETQRYIKTLEKDINTYFHK